MPENQAPSEAEVQPESTPAPEPSSETTTVSTTTDTGSENPIITTTVNVSTGETISATPAQEPTIEESIPDTTAVTPENQAQVAEDLQKFKERFPEVWAAKNGPEAQQKLIESQIEKYIKQGMTQEQATAKAEDNLKKFMETQEKLGGFGAKIVEYLREVNAQNDFGLTIEAIFGTSTFSGREGGGINLEAGKNGEAISVEEFSNELKNTKKIGEALRRAYKDGDKALNKIHNFKLDEATLDKVVDNNDPNALKETMIQLHKLTDKDKNENAQACWDGLSVQLTKYLYPSKNNAYLVDDVRRFIKDLVVDDKFARYLDMSSATTTSATGSVESTPQVQPTQRSVTSAEPVAA